MPKEIDTKVACDPTDACENYIEAQVTIIANNPRLADPFRKIFETDPLHSRFIASKKPAVRIGVYKSEEGTKYYNYDTWKTDGRQEFDSVSELLNAQEEVGRKIRFAKSKRIYFHGHGNGGGDGISGDHVDEVGTPYASDLEVHISENITNDDLLKASVDIINKGDRAHFSFLSCNYANPEQASSRPEQKTNALRFYEKLDELRAKGVKTTVAAATTPMALDSKGKNFDTGLKWAWKHPSTRKLLFQDQEAAIEIIKSPLASVSTAVTRKQNILNFLKNPNIEIVFAGKGINHSEFMKKVIDDPKIVNFKGLDAFIADDANCSSIRFDLEEEWKKEYQKIEHKCDDIDAKRLCDRLQMIANKEKSEVDSNDSAYVVLANCSEEAKEILNKKGLLLDDLNKKFKENGVLTKAYRMPAIYDIAGIDSKFAQITLAKAIGNENPLTMAMELDKSDARVKELQRVLGEYDKKELIDHQNSSGNTALMLAAEKGCKDSLKILLACTPNINIQNNDGETALMLAQDKSCFMSILDQQPDLSKRDNDGNTIANFLVQNQDKDKDKDKELLDKLLENPAIGAAQLNMPNYDGITPLMFAARFANLELVVKLMEKGADPRLTTPEGKTAINFVPKDSPIVNDIKNILRVNIQQLNEEDLKTDRHQTGHLETSKESKQTETKSQTDSHPRGLKRVDKPDDQERGAKAVEEQAVSDASSVPLSYRERFRQRLATASKQQAVSDTLSVRLSLAETLRKVVADHPEEAGEADEQLAVHPAEAGVADEQLAVHPAEAGGGDPTPPPGRKLIVKDLRGTGVVSDDVRKRAMELQQAKKGAAPEAPLPPLTDTSRGRRP